MKRIPLNKGQYAIVDDADFEFLLQWKWHVSSTGYATRTFRDGNRNARHERMHQILLPAEGKVYRDHINRNKLDNRRSNLRFCTQRINMINRKGWGSSGYRGVCFNKQRNKWKVQLRHNGKNLCIGNYDDILDAAVVSNVAMQLFYGSDAVLNDV